VSNESPVGDRVPGFKMWLNCDETAALERFLELGEPRFHVATAALWNATAALERFCRISTETETKTAF